MIKIIFFLMIFINGLFALDAVDFAKRLVKDEKHNAQIELLFSNKNYQDNNNRLNLDKVINTLKMNSLINFTLKEPRYFTLRFSANTDRILFLKIINESLARSGIMHFIPSFVELIQGEVYYEIKLESRYILDPGVFYKILKSYSVLIDDIEFIGDYDQSYKLDFSKAFLRPNASAQLNTKTQLKKPLRDYILFVNNATSIEINSIKNDIWFPKILFLDRNLNLVKAIESQNRVYNFKDNIPASAFYIVIGDNYNLENIKRGLEILLKTDDIKE